MSTTNHLLRHLAPIPSAAWKEIDQEAKERLTALLSARRLVDWAGTGGWRHSATDLGRTVPVSTLPPGIEAGTAGLRARQRVVQPLAEVRVPFTLSRHELDDVERGAKSIDLDALDAAARVAAEIENSAVFHGWPGAGITGLVAATADAPSLGRDPSGYPVPVATAVDRLRRGGVEGPYALAIGPAGYTRIIESTEHGHLIIDHLERILGGKVVWTPGLDGAVVLSQRGGDFLLDVGQDVSIGYSHHDADTVTLYLEETFTFRVVEEDAAISLGTTTV